MQIITNGKTIELIQGDITEQNTDAIVNAANTSLILGGGVAGAIRMKGGPAIQEECNRIGGITIGGAAITTGGKLKARHVIHTAGPRKGEGNEDKKLLNATVNSLKTAAENNLKSISFPAISTGVFGYPIERCAPLMLTAAADFLKSPSSVEQIVFVLFTNKDYEVFENALKELQII